MQPSDLPHADLQTIAGAIDPRKTALVVVDVQVDFAEPEILVRNGVDPAPVAAAIDRMEAVLGAVRKAGLAVLFVRVVTAPETDSRALKDLYRRRGRPYSSIAIARRGTPGVGYYRLFPEPGDMEVEKVLFDAFDGTNFEAQLKARGIESLIFVGMTTDCCLDQAVRGAFQRNYDAIVVSDAAVAYTPALHMAGLTALESNCALLARSDDLIAALTAVAVPA